MQFLEIAFAQVAPSHAETFSSHWPSFFSMTSSILLAYGSSDGPDDEVKEAGSERDRWTCVEDSLRAVVSAGRRWAISDHIKKNLPTTL